VGTVTASSNGYFVIVTEVNIFLNIVSVISLPLLRHTIIVSVTSFPLLDRGRNRNDGFVTLQKQYRYSLNVLNKCNNAK
jgi:hypothetical protein